MNANAEKFGKFVADQRKALGMTQAELGDILNVTDKAISKWERGLGFPDINSLVPLAKALHVSIDELMKSEKNMTKEESNEAILNTIGIADEQLRKTEKRSIFISLLIIAALIFMLLIGENAKADSLAYMGFFVYIPITFLLTGLIFLLKSFFQKKKSKPYKTTLTVGLIMIGIVIAMIVFFFIAGIFLFPIQN